MINLDFRLEIPEEKVAVAQKMEFDIAGQKQYVNFADAKKDENGRYVFRCILDATQMKETVIATMLYSDDTVAATKEYSVEQYLEAVKSLPEASEAITNLTNAVASFGDCMNAYISSNFSGVSPVTLTSAEETDLARYNLDTTGVDQSDAINSIAPSKVRLNMGSQMNVKVKYECDTAGDYTFYVNDVIVTPVRTEDGGKVYYEVASPRIAPLDYDKKIKFTVKTGDTVENYLYSPLKYVQAALIQYADKANYRSLFNAVAKYHYTAVAYMKN